MLIIYFVAFILIVVCLVVTESGRAALEKYVKINHISNISFSDGLIGCVVGLSLAFGLLTIVFLLGYGLVEIPISYFRFASNTKKLKHYQCKVAEYDE